MAARASSAQSKHGINGEAPSPTKKNKLETKEGNDWQAVHDLLEADKFIGTHGGANAAYFGLAELRAHADLDKVHATRHKDEYHHPGLHKLLQNPHTRRRWNDIVTLDPLGMYARRPTMAATTAIMNIPELSGEHQLESDGKVVNADGTFNVLKVALDLVWDLPRFSERLKMDEKDVRRQLAKYTKIEGLMDESRRVFLPPVGGISLYVFGDVEKLAEPSTEVAVRVHDSCIGSDVFCTDICTCRPYLIFAIKGAVECAKRGGVGVIAYFQKEGRSLGEVTKFRVYNARKMQEGGDRPETYFKQTEAIAGIRDARFQEMMPDVLLWLGIDRIDWLLSMSSDKYEAIAGANIEVMQRVSLPDNYVPPGAQVEITAKISAGYHTDKVIESGEVVSYLRTLDSVRARAQKVYELAKANQTRFFNLHAERIPGAAEYVLGITKKHYPDMKIPFHSRWRNFPDGLIEGMVQQWPCDPIERARRLIDMVTVSVLLDAGSGPHWKYVTAEGNIVVRSEGLALAALDMFKRGLFSSDEAQPFRVNALGLERLSLRDFLSGFQITNSNVMAGVENRHKLLKRLAAALQHHKEFFGGEIFRPGHIVDYVLKNVDANKTVSLRVLWRAVIEGYESIWPNTLSGIRRGDIWVYGPLKEAGKPGSDLMPFHKLSQWLTLSMLEPLQEIGIKIVDLHLFTGLAEYRNGGFMIDYGLLELKKPELAQKSVDVGSELVVEWRALTVALVDELRKEVAKKAGLREDEFTVPQLLQGGTWMAGRQIAKEKRPDGVPPLSFRSDGNVF